MRITIEIEGAGSDQLRVASDSAPTPNARMSIAAPVDSMSNSSGINAGPAPSRPGESGNPSMSIAGSLDPNGMQSTGISAGAAPQLN
jgi:hypothetical protein